MLSKKESEDKLRRIETTIALEEPDRVPFAPFVNGYYQVAYGIDNYEVMMDFRNIIPGIQSYLEELDPDAVAIAGLYGIPTLEAMGTQFIRWPGADWGLELDTLFQHLDGTYLMDDEFDEYLQDPTHFTLTKLLPRKHKNMQGLSDLYLRETFDTCFFNDLALIGMPAVQQSLNFLMKAGEAQAKRAQQLGEVMKYIGQTGYSSLVQGTMCVPFDAYADSMRGIVRAAQDTMEFPDELEAVLERITDMNVGRILDIYQARGAKRIFIPLHCGVDEFMSNASYERFYWPGLKACIDGIVERGMQAYVFCEGKYNTRLEFLADVPKGKVVYCFEEVDMKRVKEIVGKTACICGNLPSTLLISGTKEQVERATKEQIDILAPGGGFIMNCSLILDNANRENMKVWKEATLQYGAY